ncbi:hypothetical protein AFCDBAGC_3081 [Methylobacterium cerastii]|uniref:Uncharacterized protein n=1 Tax=Methylobacterium cerastii TaxID=932741 RepID=A0ABQ4QIW8_9HYPH|nr:hypothetical protein [Methylobacterium cerastii]GJD45210.1 hypothetical protein AFCDBAGC_3081 [Methylobacterium cerastii]
MNPLACITALAISLLTLGTAHAETAAPTTGMRETALRFDPAFQSGRAPIPTLDGPPDCRPIGEADKEFQERIHPPADVPIPAERVQWWDGSKATAFILAAWTDAERRGEVGWGNVERVYVRTRPDISGFAKVHFASTSRGFVCGFRQPLLITAERLGYGINGRPQPTLDQVWPKGDPMPGMSRKEVDDLKMLYGLRNQLERGTESEQRGALQGFMELMTPPDQLNGAEAPSARPVRPSVDPKYAPTIREMQEGAVPRPRGCEHIPIENCLVIQRR